MRYKLVSPDGALIMGTIENLRASCGINNDEDGASGVTKNADGTFDFEYDEDGTEVDWESQETVTDAEGHRIFYDENWSQWPENVLKLEPVLDEEWYDEQAASMEEGNA